jgi:3-oxoacyl-[acyl-carrier protein] reductase
MRNVVVTGGSRGIGLAICRTLHAAGYRVIAIARSQSSELGEAIRDAESRSPGSFRFVPFDLGQTDAISELVRQIRKESGAIFGLVNNAGISSEGALGIMPNERIEQMVRVNTIAPMVLTKYVVRAMMSDGGGRVVNISSIVAATGYKGLSVYAATKSSIVGFTRSLAREVGQLGVTVNAVAPGFVSTDLTRGLNDEERARIERRSALRRLADVDDIAGAVEFLLSDKAKNITGTVLTVDAGATA